MNLGGARVTCGRGHCDDGRRLDGPLVYYRLHCGSHGDCGHESGHAADDDGHDCPGLAHVLDDARPNDRLACLLGDDPHGSDPGSDRGGVDMARPEMGEVGMEDQLEGKAGIRAEEQNTLYSLVPGTLAKGCEGALRRTQEKGHEGVGVLAREADIHTA